ncbi:MAG: hypothetical protein KR126chlam6_00731 [Candidatus Anoxychlamydiales bacterium]|nr:hypothetical protein [Candidatus Anoxychlamydiales bacterium]
MRKKRYMSLLEIMIVILLIGIITSVVGFNVKGSLEKGKVFKTEQAQNQIRDLLLLEVSEGTAMDVVVRDPETYLKKSGIIKNEKTFMTDGWNERFIIEATKNGSDIKVTSKRLENYNRKNNRNSNESSDQLDETQDY